MLMTISELDNLMLTSTGVSASDTSTDPVRAALIAWERRRRAAMIQAAGQFVVVAADEADFPNLVMFREALVPLLGAPVTAAQRAAAETARQQLYALQVQRLALEVAGTDPAEPAAWRQETQAYVTRLEQAAVAAVARVVDLCAGDWHLAALLVGLTGRRLPGDPGAAESAGAVSGAAAAGGT